MGGYEGAEVCELVGTYLIHKLSLKYNKNDIGLYLDDGLVIFKNFTGPKSEKVKKDIQNFFKENEVDILIRSNMKRVNYLDITLNLEKSAYCTYQKENNQKKKKKKKVIESNLPPFIIKQLLLSIESQLSSLTSSEEIFNDSVIPYQDVLEKSGYKHKLKCKANIDTPSNKNEGKRNILWFNPPYTKNLKTKIILNLIKKHFRPHHKFQKLFNNKYRKNYL